MRSVLVRGERILLGLVPVFALGLGALLADLQRRPWIPLWAGLVVLFAWNDQLLVVWNSQRLASRSEALSLERVAEAQVEVLYRSVMKTERFLPRRVSFYLYENLKGVFLDEGPRSLGGIVDLGREPDSLPELVGHNWTAPRERDGTTCRLSSGKRSWLRIPVRTPGAFEATLRARSELGDVPLTITLEVNGRGVGSEPIGTDWTEAAFRVPPDAMRRGFNEVALVFSTTRQELTPGHAGRNGAAAVDFLRLRRLDARDGPI